MTEQILLESSFFYQLMDEVEMQASSQMHSRAVYFRVLIEWGARILRTGDSQIAQKEPWIIRENSSVKTIGQE